MTTEKPETSEEKEVRESSTSNARGNGSSESTDAFGQQIKAELEQTELEIRQLAGVVRSPTPDRLTIARQCVEKFQPVPQFVWRMVNFSIARAGRVNKLQEGMLFGLKKLVLNCAADRVLGPGKPVDSVRGAIANVSSDIIAAVAVMHAVSRKLRTRDYHAVWGPILDDALLRAIIGYYVGTMCEGFGPGRGMLAGFCGRAGLAVLVATGTADQAQSAIALLSGGKSIRDVAISLYDTDPIEVSAMILSAAGCGRDAVLGVAGFAMGQIDSTSITAEQRRWLSALSLTEASRTSAIEDISEDIWILLGYHSMEERKELGEIINTLKRRGHGLTWLM